MTATRTMNKYVGSSIILYNLAANRLSGLGAGSTRRRRRVHDGRGDHHWRQHSGANNMRRQYWPDPLCRLQWEHGHHDHNHCYLGDHVLQKMEY